ncbi:sugar ABC transporter substrate-binding protein [Caldicellulosiruptor acetigenus]|uniref:sugar ABC transporter substrate-binding protein n=1 Tax=Caldicellulosiruptor acetigenus TaxID=301953 RepID=UPI0004019493|nr:substrate-binding domain-containing protein [Caldicellulosiruptor acetigenus]WAM36365.1 substrate-binding domain-containing protein [Caldicellulosiruptor acetigenus]
MRTKLQKFSFRIMVAVSVVIFVAIVLYDIYNIRFINTSTKKVNLKSSTRVMMILPQNQTYWNWFLDQFEKMSEKQGILPDIVFYNTSSEAYKFLKLAEVTRPDAIVMCNIYNSKEIAQALSSLKNKGIFIASLFNDMLFRYEDVFVGIDYYYKGKIAGKIIYKVLNEKKSIPSKLKIAIVNPLYTTIGGALEVKGLVDFLKAKGIKDIAIKNFNFEYPSFPPEEVARQLILENAQKFNVIYVGSETDTMTVAQNILTFNKLDQFIVIGAGTNEKLQKYVREKIINGIINDNGQLIAQKLCEALLSWKKFGHASSYISTNFEVIE